MKLTTFCLLCTVTLMAISWAIWGYDSEWPDPYAKTMVDHAIWFFLGGFWMILLRGINSA